MTLKSELDQFGQLFKQHLNGNMKASLRWVTATAVNWDEQTMTATDSDELEYFDVLLGVGTMAVKPVLNTDCLIAIIEGDEATAFLLHADEAELIQFNGGSNGGLTITPTLKDNLEKNNAILKAMLDVITGPELTQAANTPSVLQVALKTAVTGKEMGDFAEIENTKIMH
ncbi:hypothetical protein [Carboxylicivirga linearis]|uniref:SCP2 domain-containing protein n=1 Tax=Carboxylicivirga linearis TaxID=1628157 RepID=A0ABS5JWA6_9BACT|nr:hypothetical protein [Carboxylicivirga linearis]MBS2099192.1 hypothetical protein [Carboxylicivirga linearis]